MTQSKMVDNSSSSNCGSLTSCCNRIKGFFSRHERTMAITGLVLGILLALLAVGLICMSGVLSSPALLCVGAIMLIGGVALISLCLSYFLKPKPEICLEVLEKEIRREIQDHTDGLFVEQSHAVHKNDDLQSQERRGSR